MQLRPVNYLFARKVRIVLAIMENLTRTIAIFGVALSFLTAPVSAKSGSNNTSDTLALGIDRSNLSSTNFETQASTMTGVQSLGATWFRDGFSDQSAHGFDDFLNEVKLANLRKLKFLDIVSPVNSDFDYKGPPDNAGAEFCKHCGWRQGSRRLSHINLEKFASRLRAELSALKAHNLMIDAFEIGNEFDSCCFNGDVPNGREATALELEVAVHAYGEFLRKAATIIQAPTLYPEAKIITFGLANTADKWDKPPHHISQPARMISMLRNNRGFNYLDNSQYHVDGYGVHMYGWPNELKSSIQHYLQTDIQFLGTDKPLWVTEWGFLDKNAFPNTQNQTINMAITEFLDEFNNFRGEIPFGPIFFYRYDEWLTDANGQFLPSAQALRQYCSRRQ